MFTAKLEARQAGGALRGLMELTPEEYHRLEIEARALLRGRRVVRRPDTASLCNRTYLRVLEHYRRSPGKGPPRTIGYWVVALRNELLNHMRRENCLKRRPGAEVDEDIRSVPESRPGPDSAIEVLERVRLLVTGCGVAGADGTDRLLIERSPQEVARVLGIQRERAARR